MKTVKTNFETLSHGLQKDRYKSKKYDWLHEIAAVNELARAKHLSYGQFVSEGFMAFVKIPRPPRGYKTARERELERRLKGFTLEAVVKADQ